MTVSQKGKKKTKFLSVPADLSHTAQVTCGKFTMRPQTLRIREEAANSSEIAGELREIALKNPLFRPWGLPFG